MGAALELKQEIDKVIQLKLILCSLKCKNIEINFSSKINAKN